MELFRAMAVEFERRAARWTSDVGARHLEATAARRHLGKSKCRDSVRGDRWGTVGR